MVTSPIGVARPVKSLRIRAYSLAGFVYFLSPCQPDVLPVPPSLLRGLGASAVPEFPRSPPISQCRAWNPSSLTIRRAPSFHAGGEPTAARFGRGCRRFLGGPRRWGEGSSPVGAIPCGLWLVSAAG